MAQGSPAEDAEDVSVLKQRTGRVSRNEAEYEDEGAEDKGEADDASVGEGDDEDEDGDELCSHPNQDEESDSDSDSPPTAVETAANARSRHDEVPRESRSGSARSAHNGSSPDDADDGDDAGDADDAEDVDDADDAEDVDDADDAEGVNDADGDDDGAAVGIPDPASLHDDTSDTDAQQADDDRNTLSDHLRNFHPKSESEPCSPRQPGPTLPAPLQDMPLKAAAPAVPLNARVPSPARSPQRGTQPNASTSKNGEPSPKRARKHVDCVSQKFEPLPVDAPSGTVNYRHPMVGEKAPLRFEGADHSDGRKRKRRDTTGSADEKNSRIRVSTEDVNEKTTALELSAPPLSVKEVKAGSAGDTPEGSPDRKSLPEDDVKVEAALKHEGQTPDSEPDERVIIWRLRTECDRLEHAEEAALEQLRTQATLLNEARTKLMRFVHKRAAAKELEVELRTENEGLSEALRDKREKARETAAILAKEREKAKEAATSFEKVRDAAKETATTLLNERDLERKGREEALAALEEERTAKSLAEQKASLFEKERDAAKETDTTLVNERDMERKGRKEALAVLEEELAAKSLAEQKASLLEEERDAGLAKLEKVEGRLRSERARRMAAEKVFNQMSTLFNEFDNSCTENGESPGLEHSETEQDG